MKIFVTACIVLSFSLIGCTSDVVAQDAPPPKLDPDPSPAAKDNVGTIAAPAPAGVSVDEILDALDRQGDHMKDFTADVALTETDELTKEGFTRAGTVKVQKLAENDARIHIIFDTRKTDAKTIKEKIEYLLDKGWLTERNYRKKNQVRRQVIKPGETVDLLKLGEGPFPLPIGQAKEDVKDMFDVEVLPPVAGDPPHTIHGRLTPKKGSQFERRFKHIDVWVDPNAQMPRRIETVDINEQTRQTTDLENVKTNTGLGEADFRLDEVTAKQGWTFVDEPYQE
ncbi:MAG TPA: hypothetical protein VGR35_18770 [Tepidisphaeraceae bacterium]|nr:hypothetical protein [Tepidisphaeraceae bacterium]